MQRRCSSKHGRLLGGIIGCALEADIERGDSEKA